MLCQRLNNVSADFKTMLKKGFNEKCFNECRNFNLFSTCLYFKLKAITKIRKKKKHSGDIWTQKRDYTVCTKARNQAKWETRKAHQSFEKKIATEAKLKPCSFL